MYSVAIDRLEGAADLHADLDGAFTVVGVDAATVRRREEEHGRLVTGHRLRGQCSGGRRLLDELPGVERRSRTTPRCESRLKINR